MTARAGAAAGVLGVLAVVLAVTWPLARCLDRCLGPPPDTLLSVYFLAWVTHALRTPGVRLLDAPMFAPHAATLALGEYVPAYAPVAAPVIGLTGNPVAAHNVVLLLLYVLGTAGAARLGRRLAGPGAGAAAGLVAGLAFGVSPRLLDQSYNVQTLSVAWVPWLFLAVEAFLSRPTWARAAVPAAIGLALALSSMNVFTYTGVALTVWLAVALATRDRRLRAAHVVRALAAGLPAAAILGAYLAPYRAAAHRWELGRTLAEIEANAATVAHLLRPPPESLVRRALGGDGLGGTPVEGVLLGVTVAVLAAGGLAALAHDPATRRALRPYTATAAAALVLALGPTLATPWGGLPLPYRALHAVVPGFQAIRTPARFLLLVDLGVALLAAAGAARWLGRLAGVRRRAAVPALGALILAESVLVPFPGAAPRLDPAGLPEVYRWLRDQPAGTVALGLPMGDWVNVAASAFHLRRTVNGWASFEPPRYRELAAAMAAFPDDRTLALARGAGTEVLLVDRAWLGPGRAAALDERARELRLDRVFPTHRVYRVLGPAPPGPEALVVEARAEPGLRPRACLVLRNPGPEHVPLYPARRLRIEAIGAAGTPLDAVVRWLPLDLGPGGTHRECLAAEPGPLVEVRGRVDGTGEGLAFALAPGGPPRRLGGPP